MCAHNALLIFLWSLLQSISLTHLSILKERCQHYSETYSVWITVITTISSSASFLCASHPAQERGGGTHKNSTFKYIIIYKYIYGGWAMEVMEQQQKAVIWPENGHFLASCCCCYFKFLKSPFLFVLKKVWDLIHFIYMKLMVRSWKRTGQRSDIGDRATKKDKTWVWTMG